MYPFCDILCFFLTLPLFKPLLDICSNFMGLNITKKLNIEPIYNY